MYMCVYINTHICIYIYVHHFSESVDINIKCVVTYRHIYIHLSTHTLFRKALGVVTFDLKC